jgi:hypothetical protein
MKDSYEKGYCAGFCGKISISCINLEDFWFNVLIYYMFKISKLLFIDKKKTWRLFFKNLIKVLH